MLLRFLFLFVIYFNNIYCYNKTILVKDVAKCKELFLQNEKHYYTDIVIPLEDLQNNKPKDGEILRMKAYFLGSDFYIEMMSNGNKPIYYNHYIRFYHTALGGWGGKKSKISISGLDEEGLTCDLTDTPNLLHSFYFTELDMVVTKKGYVQYFEHGNPRLSCQLERIRVSHLAFGIGVLGDGRVFYDCPDKDFIAG